MADLLFNRFLANIQNKEIDLEADTIKCALLLNTYTPDKDHNVWADVSTYEHGATGNYVAGGATLTTKAVAQDDANDKAWFNADDVTWTSSTITARYAVIVDTTMAADELIALYDFTTDKSSSGSDFKIEWAATGLFDFAQA